MPKLIWHNPNVYLTDPHLRRYAPTLSQHKLLGDNRREQMVSVHERHFVPYRSFCNCEYYAFPRSRVSDLRVFEYSFLQSLAVAPNLCPAETRTFLDRIPSRHRDACVAFMRKWMSFIRENFGAWKHTLRVGDAPGLGAAEAYAHPYEDGRHTFLCLVNQNPFPRAVRLCLDGSIGLTDGDRLQVDELYPQVCPVAEQTLPFCRLGDEFHCEVPPHGARYLRVAPWRNETGVQVLGWPAEVRDAGDGHELRLCAPQGQTLRLGVVLPDGQRLKSVVARHLAPVPMYRFEAGVSILATKGNLAWLELKTPRKPAPRAITNWRIEPDGSGVMLPRLGECGFLGALVHGAFSEDLEVAVTLETERAEHGESLLPPPPSPARPHPPLASAARQTFVATLDLPFIESYGCDAPLEDDAVMELAFSDPAQVQTLTLRLGGVPVEVQRYRYPKNREWFTYYVELAGNAQPGPQELRLDVEWRES